ncbi:hypothetical protein HDV04_004551 [Boothiomyces sp. JEL0838]|nr:hypothetical protein HDV04_004551 [Boothiomyces sp. JEL0838]
MAKDHYLVIGGCGFLGQALCTQLLDRGNTVSIFDLRINGADPRLAEAIQGDITDPVQVSNACKNKTIVIHTASPIHGKATAVYFKVNVEGTRNAINACLEQGVSKLIFTSSASVTFNGEHLINADETVPYCKVHMDAYNESKAIAETEVLNASCEKLLTCAIRPSGIFGPKDAQGSFAIAESGKKGQWRLMVGNNQNLFDVTYVDNVAYAHILAADKIEWGNGIDGQAFYITNDQPIFFWDYPKRLLHEMGYRNTQKIRLPNAVAFAIGALNDFISWVASPFATLHPTLTRFRVKFMDANRYYDISKAKKLLGYKPIVSLDEGFKRTANYWKEQGYGVAA